MKCNKSKVNVHCVLRDANAKICEEKALSGGNNVDCAVHKIGISSHCDTFKMIQKCRSISSLNHGTR